MYNPGPMSKIGRIITGWKNVIFENPEVERQAEARAQVCGKCPFAVEGAWEIIKDRRIEEVSGMVCSRCSCPLSAKLRSPQETCPEKLW